MLTTRQVDAALRCALFYLPLLQSHYGRLPSGPWPPGFKEEIDAWMHDFFSPEYLLPDNEIIKTPAGLHMNPRTYERVVNELANL